MTANRKRQLTLFAGTFLLLGSAVSARADFVFSFDDGSLSSGSTNSSIASYMNTKMGCVGCVTINPGGGTVYVDQTYNGDGHVVGPGTGATSLTLGDSNGATSNAASPGASDLFIANTSDGRSSNIDRIVIQFSKTLFPNGLTGNFSFDYQIFPDGTCPALNNCNGGTTLPDLTFNTNGSTLVWEKFGVAPCASVGTCQGSDPNSGKNGNSIHSPNSTSSGSELAPQLIGTWSGNLSNVSELDFIDWPATIAVDNIKFSQVPEPRGTAFLLGALVLALFAGTKLRRAAAKS